MSFLYFTLISLSVVFNGSWRIPNESFLCLPTPSGMKFQLESLVKDAPGGDDFGFCLVDGFGEGGVLSSSQKK